MLKYIIIFALGMLLTWAGSSFISVTKFEFYDSILGALLNISAIIFAIIGAWIAILYPRALSANFEMKTYDKERFDKLSEDADYLSELVEVVLVSSIVLLCVLSAEFINLIVAKAVPSSLWPYLRLAGFTVLAALTISQIWVILKVILVHYKLLFKIRADQQEIEADLQAMGHREE